MVKIVPIEDIPAGEDVDLLDLDGIEEIYNQLSLAAADYNYPLGISAVQLGIPKKMFLMRPQIVRYGLSMIGESAVDRCYHCILNATYLSCGDRTEVDSIEGCLSIPGKLYKVRRFANIKATGHLYTINPQTYKMELFPFSHVVTNAYISVVMQHEIDHGHNILVSELGDEVV